MLYDLFFVSVTVSAVIAVLLLLGPVLRRRYALTRMYLVWLILALRLLVPFRYEVPRAPVQVSVPSQVTQIAPPSGVAPSAPQEKTVTVLHAIPILWGGGTAAVLLYHFGAYFLFRRRVKPYLTELEPPRKREPGVYRCPRVRGPMLLGYFRPMILLPEVEYTPSEKDAVLTHERAHFCRGDVWYKLLLLLACAVHWFNPLVWLMSRRAGQDLEFACDELVIRRRGESYKKEYSNAILKSAERSET